MDKKLQNGSKSMMKSLQFKMDVDAIIAVLPSAMS